MSSFHEVQVGLRSPDALRDLIGPERVARFAAAGFALAETLSGRTVWNVSLDESTTGVSELVQSVLGYVAGFGIETRWLVVQANSELRQIARWVREGLEGLDNDAIHLGARERAVVEDVLAAPNQELFDRLQPQDLLLLHDPGPAGLARAASDRGITVLWRCHAGSASMNEAAERSWAFLRPDVECATAFVFSRHDVTPAWIAAERSAVVAPSIDPLSPKNRSLTREHVQDVLAWSGLLAAASTPTTPPHFTRADGSEGAMQDGVRLTTDDAPLPPNAPVVTQITRWDPAKDMPGVLAGFAEHVRRDDAHLVLAGPDPSSPEADPIGGVVFEQCLRARAALPITRRERVHLAVLPGGLDDSAMIVNALQRHAAVVAQKSVAGDQSAAVAEAMLKARPIVASGVGGIRDQIRDRQNGLLVADPADLAGFGAAVTALIDDQALADTLRYNAYADAVRQMLPDRHLVQWAALVSALLDR